MTTPDLTLTDRDTLDAAIHYLDASGQGGVPEFYDRLVALRDACPERPTLEDGIYEVPDGDGDYRTLYVRDGRRGKYRLPDGALLGDGYPLPDDTSTWRRIDGPPTVTPEQIEEIARVVSGHSEPQWARADERTRVFYRDRTREGFATAGIEVSEG